MKCSHCGARIPDGELICPRCGKRVAVGFREDAATERPVNNKPMLIAMIAVLLVLIIVTFLAFSGRLGKKSDDDQAVPVAAQTAAPQETAAPTPETTTVPTATPAPTATPSPSPMPTPTPAPTPTPVAETSVPAIGSFILMDSSSRYLTEADLEGLSWEQLTLARNEIFARHGRLFTQPQLAAYFESQPWYIGAIPANAFDSDLLSSIERSNIDLISRMENSLYGGSYY